VLYSGGDERDEGTTGGRERGRLAVEAGGADPASDAGRFHPRGTQAGDGSAAALPPLGDPRDPASYTLADEPIEDGAPVDWRHLYELVQTQLDREKDRGRAIDAKAATLFAGVIASIGFSFRLHETVVVAVAALLYLVPLLLLFSVYLTKVQKIAPNPGALLAFFPNWPVTTLVTAIDAMIEAEAFDEGVNDKKAARFDRAVVATALSTVVMLAVQLWSALRPS
jgi:hypothetical protein